MNKKSIAFQLSLSILITVILVFAAIVFLNYTFSKEILINNLGENVRQADLNALLWKMLSVSAIGLITILLLFIPIFRRTLTPLSDIVESFRKFAFGERSKKRPKNEIELLTDSLAVLQKKYIEYLNEQNQSRHDRRKYERDLKSAREIQSVLVPSQQSLIPDDGVVDLYALLHPAESIGGDLYNYFFIDPNHLLFSIGDVSGKGIPAALFMAVAHTMIKNKASILSAKQIVVEINKELSRHNSNQHFLTLFLGVLDIRYGILNYCNAAHNYPFLVTSDRQLRVLDQTHGLPIGIYSNKSYTGDSIVLREGDMLVLYTDGVIDCKDAKDHSYGTGRLHENISNMMELSSKEVVSRLMTSLDVFRGSAPQADDISLMAIRFWGNKN